MNVPPSPAPPAFTLTAEEIAQLVLLAQSDTSPKKVQVRVQALLLMQEHVSESIIENRTGLDHAAQRALRTTLRAHGLESVLARRTRGRRTSKFPIAPIIDTLRHALKTRPPEGHTRWDLRMLTDVIREQIPGANTISSESVRNLLRRELGIASIRQVEPFWLTQIKRTQRRKAKD